MIEFQSIIPNTEKRKVTTHIHSYIQIEGDFITYRLKYFADFKNEEDDSLPAVNEVRSSTEIYRRATVAGFEKKWYDKTKCWGVIIYLNGTTYDMEPFFKREKQAEEFFDTAFRWAFKNEEF